MNGAYGCRRGSNYGWKESGVSGREGSGGDYDTTIVRCDACPNSISIDSVHCTPEHTRGYRNVRWLLRLRRGEERRRASTTRRDVFFASLSSTRCAVTVVVTFGTDKVGCFTIEPDCSRIPGDQGKISNIYQEKITRRTVFQHTSHKTTTHKSFRPVLYRNTAS